MLAVEELLPQKLRRHFTSGYKEVDPGDELLWRKKFMFKLWDGEKYDRYSNKH